MRSASVKKPATYSDLPDLRLDEVGEIIAGEVVLTPRPMWRTTAGASSFCDDLSVLFYSERRPVGQLAGWAILSEAELPLGDDVLVPDFAGWRVERLPDVGAPFTGNGEPDWVCEVVTSESSRCDRIV